MVRFRVAISYKFGEVSVEGENTKEVIESIDQLKAIGKSATRKITPSPVKITEENKKGGFEFKLKEIRKLAGREVLALLLFNLDEPSSPSELSTKVSKTWKQVSSKRISSYLTATGNTPTIRGYVIKTGRGYKLNAAGRTWVKKRILPKLRS